MLSLFRKKNRKEFPKWLIEYLALDFSPKRLDHVFTSLDCETTGLSKTDSIITIGAIHCTLTEIYTDSVLDQRFPLRQSGKAAEIHGELSNDTQKHLSDYLQELICFIENRILVGHNISFDIGKINQLMQKHYGLKLKNKVLDTADLAIRLDPITYERTVGGRSKLRLDDLCKKYHIKIENRHTALGDSFLTAQLLQKLAYQLERKGIKSII